MKRQVSIILTYQSSFISYTWYMSRANIVSINIQNKLRRGKKISKNKISKKIKKSAIMSLAGA